MYGRESMRLAERFRRRFEDALEASGLEDTKVGQTCSFVSDHGLTFHGRIMDVEFNFDDITVIVLVDGEERPRALTFEEVIEEGLPDRRQWVYHDPDKSKPKSTRFIPGQLFFNQ